MLAEVVLQRLESLDIRFASLRGKQAAVALQEVAKLLGVLAQIVDLFGRRVGIDHTATRDQRAVGANDAFRNHPTERANRPPRQLVASQGLRKPHSPPVHQLGSSFGAQCALEFDVAVGAAPFEEGSHGLERLHDVGAERTGVVRPLEQVDVEVAWLSRELGEPRKSDSGGLENRFRQHRLGLAEERAGTSHRNPQVVQKLRIGVVDGALPVRRDHRRKVAEDQAEPVDRGHLRIESDGRGRAETDWIDASRRRVIRQRVVIGFDGSDPAECIDRQERPLALTGDLVDVDRGWSAVDVGPIDDVDALVQLGDRYDLTRRVSPRSAGAHGRQPESQGPGVRWAVGGGLELDHRPRRFELESECRQRLQHAALMPREIEGEHAHQCRR